MDDEGRGMPRPQKYAIIMFAFLTTICELRDRNWHRRSGTSNDERDDKCRGQFFIDAN